jgi:uncharacterized membrane protein HdeD (DUF308 family)
MHPHTQRWLFWFIRAATTGLFAGIAIVFPPLNAALAIHLYGAYVKLDGFLLIGLNASMDEERPWLLWAAVVAVLSGVAILVWPVSSPVLLFFTLAGLSIVRGAFELLSALASKTPQRSLRVLNAGLIMLLGVMLAAHGPLVLSEMVTGFAIYASLSAIGQLAIGFEQRAQDASRRPRLPGSPGSRASAHSLRV